MKNICQVLTITSICCSSPTWAQEVGNLPQVGETRDTTENSQFINGTTVISQDEFFSGYVDKFTYDEMTWEKEKTELDAKFLAQLLENSGWVGPEVDRVLSSAPRSTEWSLYRSNSGPGEFSYMAVPNTGDTPGVAFRAGGEIEVVPAAFGLGSTVVVVQDQLKQVLMAAVQGACDLPVRPREIKASASAGVVGLEVTWDTSVVCDKLGASQR